MTFLCLKGQSLRVDFQRRFSPLHFSTNQLFLVSQKLLNIFAWSTSSKWVIPYTFTPTATKRRHLFCPVFNSIPKNRPLNENVICCWKKNVLGKFHEFENAPCLIIVFKIMYLGWAQSLFCVYSSLFVRYSWVLSKAMWPFLAER